jgi:hypothetical protein
MMGQVDMQSSFFALGIHRAVSLDEDLDEDMLVGPVVGSRIGLTLDAIGISRLVEGLEYRRYCTSESALERKLKNAIDFLKIHLQTQRHNGLPICGFSSLIHLSGIIGAHTMDCMVDNV